ncbi:MAG: hypothetical protein ABH845_04275 [Candidatus Omnitrophota bacterium]
MRRNRGIICFFWGILILGMVIVGGCAGSKTYLLNLKYDTSKVPAFVSRSKGVTVAVYDFQDVRPDTQFIGKRVYRDGMADFFKPDSGTVAQVITKSVVSLLEQAGFKVTRVNRYLDPQKDDFKDIPGDAALGGKIAALGVEAKTGRVTTDTEATVRLQMDWGLVKERTWIKKLIEGMGQESDRPFYKPEHAQALLNSVLKDGLDKLLKDETQLRDKLMQGK